MDIYTIAMNYSDDDLLKSYIPLVRKIAHTYKRYGVPLEDLVQEGSIGILDAARSFDATKGAKFSTYACFWVKKRILEALGREKKESLYSLSLNDEIEIPAAPAEGTSLSFELPQTLPQEESTVMQLLYGEHRTLNEVASHLNISREKARQLRQKALRRLKVNTPLTESLLLVNNNCVYSSGSTLRDDADAA